MSDPVFAFTLFIISLHISDASNQLTTTALWKAVDVTLSGKCHCRVAVCPSSIAIAINEPEK